MDDQPEIKTVCRNYVFTLNNYEDLPDLDHPDIQYAIYQEEIGANGTPHLQGYIELKKPMRYEAVKALNNYSLDGARFDKRRAPTAKQAIDYCKKKDETYIAGPYEFGTHLGQGSRTDIKEYINAIKDGASRKQLLEDHTLEYVKFPKMVNHVRLLYKPPAKTIPIEEFVRGPIEIPKDRCLVIHGATSLGKTEFAKAHFKNPFYIRKLESLKELEPENDGIVIDDMSFKHFPAEERLAIIERRNPTCIYARFDNIPLDPDPPRIFVANYPDIFFNDNDQPHHVAAIKARLIYFHVTSHMLKNPLEVIN